MEFSIKHTQRHCHITDFFSEAAENFCAYWARAHWASQRSFDRGAIRLWYDLLCIKSVWR